MFSRRSLILSAFAANALFSLAANAGEHKNYTDAAFEAAQSAGRPILIEISASWCPTCQAQKPILSELSAQPQFKDLIILEVDFDTQTNIVKKFGARAQSTLIAFKGGKETGRTVGETRKAAIAAQLANTI